MKQLLFSFHFSKKMQYVDSLILLFAKTLIALYWRVFKFQTLIIVMKALNILYVSVATYTFCSMLWKSSLTYKRALYLIKYLSSSNLYLKIHIIDIEIFLASLACFEVIFFQISFDWKVFISVNVIWKNSETSKCLIIFL